jgi:hypothetical protein
MIARDPPGAVEPPWPFFFRERLAAMRLRLQQLWQPGKIGRDPSRLIPAEQLGYGSSARLILEIDIGELLPVVVTHDEARGLFLDGPQRREAALGHSASQSVCGGPSSRLSLAVNIAMRRSASARVRFD